MARYSEFWKPCWAICWWCGKITTKSNMFTVCHDITTSIWTPLLGRGNSFPARPHPDTPPLWSSNPSLGTNPKSSPGPPSLQDFQWEPMIWYKAESTRYASKPRFWNMSIRIPLGAFTIHRAQTCALPFLMKQEVVLYRTVDSGPRLVYWSKIWEIDNVYFVEYRCGIIPFRLMLYTRLASPGSPVYSYSRSPG